MKGVIIHKTGGSEVLEYKTDLPVPELKTNQVLVRNTYIGVNFIDTYFRSGLYKAASFPHILGCEAEGTIVALSSDSSGSSSFKIGDRVVYIYSSTYTEYTAVPLDKVVLIPSSVPEKIAASIFTQGLTALTFIREAYHVQKGEWILVHAAAGGTGLLLCQMLKRAGALVIATASTTEKRDLALKAGAKIAIGYDEEEIKNTVNEQTDGKGVAAVFDGVGQSTFDISLSVIARKGTMVSFGNASGAVEPLAISRLSANNIKLIRPTLFNYIHTRDELDGYVNELWTLLDGEDKIDIKIHEVYSLKNVRQAHEDLESRRTTGKLLLQV